MTDKVIKEAQRLLRAVPCLGYGPRALSLLPLLRLGCLSALITDEAADAGWSEHFNVEMFSLEKHTRTREPSRSRTRVERASDLMPLLSDFGVRHRHGRRLRVVSFEECPPPWPQVLERIGMRLHLPGLADSAVLTDKIAMRRWFRHLGVPVPTSTVVSGELDYPRLRARIGPVFVVQRPRGKAGYGTYLVTDEISARAVPPSPRLLVSEYVGGIGVNVHGFVPNDGAPQTLRPSVQITCVDGAGSVFGQYSGNDFHAVRLLPAAVLTECRKAMDRIGHGLHALGYRGTFGADFMVRDDAVTALEINCRLQGSTWLLGELELADGTVPTMLRHFLAQHGQDVHATPDCRPAEAAHLVIRHTGPAIEVSTVPAGGIYRLDGNENLTRRHDGPGLLECGPDDCLVACMPRPGTVLQPGSVLAWLAASRSLTTADGKTLTPYGLQLVDAVRRLPHPLGPGTSP
ncbi:ATP-grasp domain-containing protein [Streptomyces roseifaciens]|uniref:ATP-grasp domain-containing protein n=1 Tax=Streptomyces roseifaciens TaxID=1488406 RepID=UPI000718001F|nr:ATP-grasp domain-containing protein [Streptomyces roseifaciens]